MWGAIFIVRCYKQRHLVVKLFSATKLWKLLCAVSTGTCYRVMAQICHIIKSGGFANDRKDATLKQDLLPKLDRVKLTCCNAMRSYQTACCSVRPGIGASQMRRRCVRLTHCVASLQGTVSVLLNDVLCPSSPALT